MNEGKAKFDDPKYWNMFIDIPYIVHSKDGTGYYQDKDNDWCMVPQNIDGSYDWNGMSYVDDMKSSGVSEEDIIRVNQFINSILEVI